MWWVGKGGLSLGVGSRCSGVVRLWVNGSGNQDGQNNVTDVYGGIGDLQLALP